jgi:hypothetical protein
MTRLQMAFEVMIIMNVLSMMHWIVDQSKNVMKHVSVFTNEIDGIVSPNFQIELDSGFNMMMVVKNP